MAGGGRLQADALFLGISRPAMIFGVNYLFFVLNGFLILLTYIWTTSFLVLFVVFPIVHGIGYMICLKEPRAMELFLLKAKQGMRCLNRRYHGYTNSYDIY